MSKMSKGRVKNPRTTIGMSKRKTNTLNEEAYKTSRIQSFAMNKLVKPEENGAEISITSEPWMPIWSNWTLLY